MMMVKPPPNVPLYEIRLKGHLDAQWADWFDGLTITLEEDGTTLLSGPVADQAALHGLLKKVRDLGMPLVSVSPVEPSLSITLGAGKITNKIDPKHLLLRNGALLIIPPMIITFGLWGALPVAYSPDIFWMDIPNWLGLFENIFRVLAFSLPGILYFGKKETGQSLGWYLYIGGLAVYLASYLAQIVFPASVWSQSAIGFTAPAWSTLFWFAGIGLVCARSWLPISWHRAIYLLSASIFLIFHIGHTGLVYFNKVH